MKRSIPPSRAFLASTWISFASSGETDGVRVAYMSLDEWRSLGATEPAIEDAFTDRAAAEADLADEV